MKHVQYVSLWATIVSHEGLSGYLFLVKGCPWEDCCNVWMLVRWGDPHHIRNTVGSETSKYCEEETSNEIPVVVASEAG